ncbi:MAG: TetR/AcrR family transcriptional regulator [Planctomycetes bacterium]|nr:TetR/AcrR family transcriptional regulator [Planctomycetota bacterium]
MGRPNLSEARRAELLPVLAAAFAAFGYRRTTTAELASRCRVQETILYRLWPDKRAMFTAAIGFVAEHSEAIWAREFARRTSAVTTAEAVLDYESDHLGEFGLYRILFAGLSETDDPAIKAALRAAYRSFHRFIRARVAEHRRSRAGRKGPDPRLVAWAMIGLGTAVNLGRELDLLSGRARGELLATIGRHLLDP